MKKLWIGLSLMFAATASAQMDPNMNMTPSSSEFGQEMDVSMKKMDHDMAAAPMTGNADHDFTAMMVPHHQGAVEMAQAELKYGKDPELRQLARRIIADQRSEIKLMDDWLAAHSAPHQSGI
jgi:uncharacterized protein (DUF305 family)